MELSLTTLALWILAVLVYLILIVVHFEKKMDKLKARISVLEDYNKVREQFFKIDSITGKAYFKDEVFSGCGNDIHNINL